MKIVKISKDSCSRDSADVLLMSLEGRSIPYTMSKYCANKIFSAHSQSTTVCRTVEYANTTSTF